MSKLSFDCVPIERKRRCHGRLNEDGCERWAAYINVVTHRYYCVECSAEESDVYLLLINPLLESME